MTVKTFYPLTTTATAPNWFGSLQDSGTAPSTTACAFGYRVQQTASPYWQSCMGATSTSQIHSANSFIDSQPGPISGVGSGYVAGSQSGDSFVSSTAYTGTFAAGNWTLSAAFKSNGITHAGQARCRIWAGTNPNGSGARELTSGTINGSVITFSSTTITYTSTITFAAPAITLNNEYLFFQFDWGQTSVGTALACIAIWQQGSSTFVTTDFSASVAITGDLTTTEATDVFASAGIVASAGNLATIEATDAFASAGAVTTVGTLATTEATDAFAATGIIASTGALATTEAVDIFVGAGAGASVGGALVTTEATDLLAGAGAVSTTGAFATVENADLMAAAGVIATFGALAAIEAEDVFAASGSVVTTIITGDLAITEGLDLFAASGAPIITGGEELRRQVTIKGQPPLLVLQGQRVQPSIRGLHP